ncbi:YkgJ family cysteine cluster protein [candidate division KSB1 bacterium]|nr:YkgJ family cysteine cluster protein [candidate division KSB1 bacterium]
MWRETARGLRYCHKRINANTSKSLEVASFLYALIDLLIERGVLTEEELNERQKKVAERLVQKFKDSGLGVMYQDPEQDKYAFAAEAHVDCENRVQACQAICCKFPFALSKQDVEEGIIKWDFGRPYMIAHGEDGYCVHLDRVSHACTVREHRPVPCRGFDCRTYDKLKVWLDFEENTINPDLFDRPEKGNGAR